MMIQAGEFYIENILRGKAADSRKASSLKEELISQGNPLAASQ